MRREWSIVGRSWVDRQIKKAGKALATWDEFYNLGLFEPFASMVGTAIRAVYIDDLNWLKALRQKCKEAEDGKAPVWWRDGYIHDLGGTAFGKLRRSPDLLSKMASFPERYFKLSDLSDPQSYDSIRRLLQGLIAYGTAAINLVEKELMVEPSKEIEHD